MPMEDISRLKFSSTSSLIVVACCRHTLHYVCTGSKNAILSLAYSNRAVLASRAYYNFVMINLAGDFALYYIFNSCDLKCLRRPQTT